MLFYPAKFLSWVQFFLTNWIFLISCVFFNSNDIWLVREIWRQIRDVVWQWHMPCTMYTGLVSYWSIFYGSFYAWWANENLQGISTHEHIFSPFYVNRYHVLLSSCLAFLFLLCFLRLLLLISCDRSWFYQWWHFY